MEVRRNLKPADGEFSGEELGMHNSPLEVDRISGIWGSYCNIPQAIFYLLEGDYLGTHKFLVKGSVIMTYFITLEDPPPCNSGIIRI